MKTTKLLPAIAVAAALFSIPFEAAAQDITVYSGQHVLVKDGSTATSGINKTQFGQVQTGENKATYFWITNNAQDALQFTGPAAVSGPNAADFSITLQPSGPVPFFGEVGMQVTFTPSGVGARSAVITVPNNTPGDKGTFTFNVRGEGVNGFTIATPDIILAPGLSQTKTKVKKKTGEAKVSWKMNYYNLGPAPSSGGTVKFYRSADRFFSLPEDVLESEVALPALPGYNPDVKLKVKKLKLKGTFNESSGYVFAVATVLPLNPGEADQANNVAYDNYPHL